MIWIYFQSVSVKFIMKTFFIYLQYFDQILIYLQYSDKIVYRHSIHLKFSEQLYNLQQLRC